MSTRSTRSTTLLVQFAPGQTVKLEVLRDGKTQEIDVTLGTRPKDL